MLRLLPWAEVLLNLHATVEKPGDQPRLGEGTDSETDDDGSGSISLPEDHAEAQDEAEEDDGEDDVPAEDEEERLADDDQEPLMASCREARAMSPAPRCAPSSLVSSPVAAVARPSTAAPLLRLLGCLGNDCCEGRGDRREFRSERRREASPRPWARCRPEPTDGEHRIVLLGRYACEPADVIGRGGFSTVRRGVDLVSGRPVAIKTYSAMEEHTESVGEGDCESPGQGSRHSGLRRQFEDEVRSLLSLHEATTATTASPRRRLGFDDEDPDDADGDDEDDSREEQEAEVEQVLALRQAALDALPSSRDLFVEMLDFSREGDEAPSRCEQPGTAGRRAPSGSRDSPGPAADGCCYLVLELASETLRDFLRSLPAPLCKQDVRRIFRQVCEVVAGLHRSGFVHLDIKPDNLMRFPSGRFKLIDMDGILPSGCSVPVADVITTAKYCSPEFARASLEDDVEDGVMLEVTTSIDVFSLGLVGAELASRRHPLEDIWRQFMSGARNDEQGYYRFLTAPGFTVRPPMEARAVSPLFDDLLERMLHRWTRSRATMCEVLAHPFFGESLAQVSAPPPASSGPMARLHTRGGLVQRGCGGRRWTNGPSAPARA